MTSSSSRTPWLLIVVLWVTGLFAAAQFAKVSLTLDAVSLAYDRPVAALAVVVSLVGVVGMVLGALAGGVVARVGERRALVAGVAIGAAMSAIQALLPPLPLVLLTRMIEGISQLAIVVAAPTLMAELSAPKDRALVMGLWGTFFGVSFAIAALILPGLLASGGLPLVFGAHAAGLALCALALSRLVPYQPPVPVQIRIVAEHRLIYSTPSIVAPATGFFWPTLIFVALLTFLPGLLEGPLWIPAALPLISLAGTMAAGALAGRIAPNLIGFVGFAGTILLFLAGMATGTLIGLSLPMFFFVGLVPGAAFAAVPWLNHDRASIARANGAIAQLGNVGTTSGTPLFALVLSMTAGSGLAALGWLTIVLSAAGMLTIWLVYRQLAPARAALS